MFLNAMLSLSIRNYAANLIFFPQPEGPPQRGKPMMFR
jgi:hypothetical protein